jgi:hypothetical protein
VMTRGIEDALNPQWGSGRFLLGRMGPLGAPVGLVVAAGVDGEVADAIQAASRPVLYVSRHPSGIEGEVAEECTAFGDDPPVAAGSGVAGPAVPWPQTLFARECEAWARRGFRAESVVIEIRS